MTKNDFFKMLIEKKLYVKFNLMLSCFTLTRVDEDKAKPYYPFTKDGKYAFKDGEGAVVTIEDGDIKKPLLNYNNTIKATPDWVPNIGEPREVTMGDVYVNAVAITHWVGADFPFMS